MLGLELSLYYSHNILISIKKGASMEGVLTDYDAQSLRLEDGSIVSLLDIVDIEYVGALKEVHTFLWCGKIDDYRFELNDILNEEDLDHMLYKDFKCQIACHLYQNESKEIRANDIRILKYEHVLNAAFQTVRNYLYFYQDGTVMAGRLASDDENTLVQINGENCSFIPRGIDEIYLAPSTNDSLKIIKKDGSIYSGRVNGITNNWLVLLQEPYPIKINYADIKDIRYKGEVSFSEHDHKKCRITLINSAEKITFHGRLPYFPAGTRTEDIGEGAIVEFTPSLSIYNLVAKHPIILRSGTEVAPQVTKLGLLLVYLKNVVPSYGYIGDMWLNEQYRKMANLEESMPKGDVYCADQLDPIDFKYLYVVRYTETTSVTATGEKKRVARNVEIEQKLEKRTLARVWIENDTVHTLSAGVGMLQKYSNQNKSIEIEIVLKDSTSVDGILVSATENTISIQQGLQLVSISSSDILDVRYYGIITGKRQESDGGYLSNGIFFHVNDIKNTESKIWLYNNNPAGWNLQYELGFVGKGNNLTALNCDFVQRSSENEGWAHFTSDIECIITSDETMCADTTVGVYRSVMVSPFAISMISNWQEKMYRVTYYLRKNNAGDDVVVIRKVLESRNNHAISQNEGWVHMITSEECIVSPAQILYDDDQSVIYKNVIVAPAVKSLLAAWKCRSYKISYYLWKDIEDNDILLISNIINSCEHERYNIGYFHFIRLDQEYNDYYGFVIPEEHLETKKQNWRQKIAEDIKFVFDSIPTYNNQPVNTRSNYYRCIYSDGAILRIWNETPKESNTAVHASNERASHRQVTDMSKEDIDVSALLERHTDCFQDKEWSLGILFLQTTIYGRIAKRFINSRYGDAVYSETERAQVCTFSVDKVNTWLDVDSRLATGKHVYLVRYVSGGVYTNPNGTQSPSVDYNSPIQILKVFDKRNIRSIDICSENAISVTWVHTIITPSQTTAQYDLSGLSPLEAEDIIVVSEDGDYSLDIVDQVDGIEIIRLKNKGYIDGSDTIRIFRFGLISGFNTETRTGILNGCEFSLSQVEEKTYNILKTQSSSINLHVVFEWKAGEAKNILAIPGGKGIIEQKIGGLIPWKLGVVTSSEYSARTVKVEQEIIHAITVRSDHLISNLCREDRLSDISVYYRAVRHPYEGRLICAAIDLKPYTEKVNLRFDIQNGRYWGYRHQTDYFLVYGEETVLAAVAKNANNQVEVTRHVLEDGVTLQCWLDDMEKEVPLAHNSSVASICDESSQNIQNIIQEHPLFLLWLLKGAKRFVSDNRSEQDARQRWDILSRKERPSNMELGEMIYLGLKYQGITQASSAQINACFMRICKVLTRNSYDAERDNNMRFGESAYYGSIVIAYGDSEIAPSREDCIYMMFLPDFSSGNLVRQYRSRGWEKLDIWPSFESFFTDGIVDDRGIKGFLAHIQLLDSNAIKEIEARSHEDSSVVTTIVEYTRNNKLTIESVDPLSVFSKLRDEYRRLKDAYHRRIQAMLESTTVIFEQELNLWLGQLLDCPLQHMMCREDKSRMQRLADICSRLITYAERNMDFDGQVRELKDVKVDLQRLRSGILDHPSKLSLEFLALSPIASVENVISDIYGESVLDRLISKTKDRIDTLYADSIPRVTVDLLTSNHDRLLHGENMLSLIVRSEGGRRQPAENIRVNLESRTLGVQTQEEGIRLRQGSLSAGQIAEIDIPVTVNVSKDTRELLIPMDWTVEYDYQEYNGNTVVRMSRIEQGELSLQLTERRALEKNLSAVNPYTWIAQGDPINGNDAMFVGREEEMKTIWDQVIEVKGTETHLVPGRTIILFGQRKCGKTSLVNQLASRIKDNSQLNQQAILIESKDFLGDVGELTSLSDYRQALYIWIIEKFFERIKKYHPELLAEMNRSGFEILDEAAIDEMWDMDVRKVSRIFERLFINFKERFEDKYVVVLLLDEFTRLPVKILELIDSCHDDQSSEDKSRILQLSEAPKFIRKFSRDLGFIQFLIGHVAMPEALERLGWNHTGEFATVVELKELSRPDAEKLINIPVQNTQGFNPYATQFGPDAIEAICYLSGQKPLYIAKLCKAIYDDFITYNSKEYIKEDDVYRVARSMIKDAPIHFFDSILTEDDDESSAITKLPTYHFLVATAHCIRENSNDVSAYVPSVREECLRFGMSDFEFENTKNKLDRRRTIKMDKYGRIIIRCGLFLEYIRLKGL